MPIAKMAPSHVDMLAATIPIIAHAPSPGGTSFTSSFTKAFSSGSHSAHVGSPSPVWQLSVSNEARAESGP